MFTILWGHLEDILLLNKFLSNCWYVPWLQRYSPTKLCDGAQMAIFGDFFGSCIFSKPHAAPHGENFHLVWSWYEHPLLIAFRLLIRYVTLWAWPLNFDLGHWSYMADHAVNPSTKFQDPIAIRSWLMSSDIPHKISFTMRLQPLRMRHIMWHIDI